MPSLQLCVRHQLLPELSQRLLLFLCWVETQLLTACILTKAPRPLTTLFTSILLTCSLTHSLAIAHHNTSVVTDSLSLTHTHTHTHTHTLGLYHVPVKMSQILKHSALLQRSPSVISQKQLAAGGKLNTILRQSTPSSRHNLGWGISSKILTLLSLLQTM